MKYWLILNMSITLLSVLTCGDRSDPFKVDNLPPVIGEYGTYPDEPRPGQNVIFWVMVTDYNQNIMDVNIFYSLGDETNRIEMNNSEESPDEFRVTLPPMPAETNCIYYFEATDRTDLMSRSDESEFMVLYNLPAIYTSPISDTIMIQEAAYVDLRIGGVVDFFAISMELNYNTSIVQIDSITVPSPGIWGDNNPILIYNNISNGMGLAIGNIQTPEEDDVSGYGSICLLYLKGIASGTSSIEFNNISIYDENGLLNPYLPYLETVPFTIHIE